MISYSGQSDNKLDKHRYRHEASLSTWIFRVAHSVCLNYRDSKRHTEVPMEPDVTQADPSVESNPLAYLLAREDRQLIYEALASLSDQQRTIFVFKVVRQWSYVEIAEALGISAAAVRMGMYRARKGLQSWFQAKRGESNEL